MLPLKVIETLKNVTLNTTKIVASRFLHRNIVATKKSEFCIESYEEPIQKPSFMNLCIQDVNKSQKLKVRVTPGYRARGL